MLFSGQRIGQFEIREQIALRPAPGPADPHNRQSPL